MKTEVYIKDINHYGRILYQVWVKIIDGKQSQEKMIIETKSVREARIVALNV